MSVGVKSVGIGKRGIKKPERRGFFVHHRNEIFDSSADVICHSDRRVVRRRQHDGVKQIREQKTLPLSKISRRALDPDRFARHGDDVVKRRVLERDDGGHYFRSARHRQTLTGVLFKKYFSVGSRNKRGGPRRHRRNYLRGGGRQSGHRKKSRQNGHKKRCQTNRHIFHPVNYITDE